MSDVKAKAEARRAKILARESSKKVQAIGDDISLPVDGTPQERPLARRRTFVKSLSENFDGVQNDNRESATPAKLDLTTDDVNVESTSSDAVTGSDRIKSEKTVEVVPESRKDESKPKVEIHDDPDVESIDQLMEKQNKDASPSKPTETTPKKVPLQLSPKKSFKQIEEEVAANTAKFDAETMRIDRKPRKSGKELKDDAQTKKSIAVASNINPTNVTRLVRMFVIIALGAYKGYHVVQDNIASRDNSMILAMEGVNAPLGLDEFGDTVQLSGAEKMGYQAEQHQSSSNSNSQQQQSRTWAQWAQYKVTAPFESTLTAVGVSYWLANMLSSGINSRLKNPPKSKGILEQLLALYQSGFEGVLERVFCLIGEYALHLGTILLVVTVLTIYTEIPTTTSGGSFSSSSLDASAAAVVDVVSSTVSGVVKTATATAGGDGVQGEL